MTFDHTTDRRLNIPAGAVPSDVFDFHMPCECLGLNILKTAAKRFPGIFPECQKSAHYCLMADGACSHNGKPGARAGYGVYCNRVSARVSERVPAHLRQTNQVAEIMSAIAAVHIATQLSLESDDQELNLRHTVIVIIMDSAYVVNAMSDWVFKWRKNNYRSCKGIAVVNADLLRSLDEMVCELEQFEAFVRFWHVPRALNCLADKLATQSLA